MSSSGDLNRESPMSPINLKIMTMSPSCRYFRNSLVDFEIVQCRLSNLGRVAVLNSSVEGPFSAPLPPPPPPLPQPFPPHDRPHHMFGPNRQSSKVDRLARSPGRVLELVKYTLAGFYIALRLPGLLTKSGYLRNACRLHDSCLLIGYDGNAF